MAHLKELADVVQHAFEQSPAFRKRLSERRLTPNDFKHYEDLEKLPVLRKESLIDLQRSDPPFGGFLAVDLKRLSRIFQSPGPIYDPQGSGLDYWRFGEPLRLAGFGEGDIVINTFSYHLSPAGFMFDDGLRSVGAVVVPTGVGNTEIQLQVIEHVQATGYVGTPSFLQTLLNKSLDFGTQFTIAKAFFAGEPFTAEQRKIFDQAGIRASQAYGTADAGMIAFECDEKEGLHISPGLILEIVDSNTGKQQPPGEIGELVVTVFDETYPLIRFSTGDLSRLLTETCPCGLNTKRIAGFLGRSGDAVKVRGMFVHPRQLAEVIAAFPQLGDFAAEISREKERDFFKLSVEMDDAGVSDQVRGPLERKIKEVLRVKADELLFVEKGALQQETALVDKREWQT